MISSSLTAAAAPLVGENGGPRRRSAPTDATGIVPLAFGGFHASIPRAFLPSHGFFTPSIPKPRSRTAQRALLPGYEAMPRPEVDVKVREGGSKQQPGRRVVAEALVQAPVEEVWRVLTDFEALPAFVPNLERCERLSSPRPGVSLVRQVACSQGGLWRLEAEAVLEVEEIKGPLGRREARFSAVSGDFTHFSGRWVVEPDIGSASGMASVLRYDVSVQPRIPVPSSVVAYIVKAGLPANIHAIVQRAEELAERRLQASGLASWAGVEEDPPLPLGEWQEGKAAAKAAAEAALAEPLPSKGPFWPAGSLYAAAAPLTAEQQRQRANKAAARSAYLGTASVPLPPAGSPDATIQQALNERLEEKEQLQALYPAFALKQHSADPSKSSSSSSSNGAAERENPLVCPAPLPAEVHLRRLDNLDFVHRRAVAAITVDAPASAVWEVLTDYDRLAEFVPNLAASTRIKLPPSAPPNVVRVRQVGYKRMMYICLHAESVLDLIEKPCSEIQFRQVAGDFERYQGKWMLQEVAPDPDSVSVVWGSGGLGECGPQTQLKYAMEIVIPRNSRMLSVIEPLLEGVVFEDVPANLAAIKLRVEAMQVERRAAELEAQGQGERAAGIRRRSSRPRLVDMAEDFGVLAAELERCFGGERVLPPRDTLRDMGRTDLEKAVTAHGGPAVVVDRLGWKLKTKPRKPRGYWDSLDNVRQEVDEFIADNQLQPRVMPVKNDFIRAGRNDLCRAIERWGGLYELAAELGYAVASPVFASTEWQEHVSETAATTGLSGKQGLFELAAATYKPRDEEPRRRRRKQQTSESKREYSKMPTVREEIDAW